MNNESRDRLDILDELRRRKVLRSTTIYALVGWSLLQVADVLFGRWGLPEWAVTLVLTAVVLGFPVVVALAWVFEISPEGVQRTSAEREPALLSVTHARLVDVFVILLFCATLALLYWDASGADTY